MRTDDHSYFSRRTAEERIVADVAVCPEAAAAHRELAERYAELAAGEMDQPAEDSLSARADGRLGSRAPLRKCR